MDARKKTAALRCHEMELLCRQYAELDSATPSAWLEQAELWSRLMIIEDRLDYLQQATLSCQKPGVS